MAFLAEPHRAYIAMHGTPSPDGLEIHYQRISSAVGRSHWPVAVYDATQRDVQTCPKPPKACGGSKGLSSCRDIDRAKGDDSLRKVLIRSAWAILLHVPMSNGLLIYAFCYCQE